MSQRIYTEMLPPPASHFAGEIVRLRRPDQAEALFVACREADGNWEWVQVGTEGYEHAHPDLEIPSQVAMLIQDGLPVPDGWQQVGTLLLRVGPLNFKVIRKSA